MPLHIQDGGRAKFGGHEALVEVAGRNDFGEQFIGNHLARLVVTRISGKHFGFESPVLVDLRGELHEVTGHRRTAHRVVGALAQQAVQRVTKLMEHGLHVVEAQQRRLIGRRLVEIAHIDDDGADILPFRRDVLVADIVHPRPAALGVTREIVGQQHADQRTVRIRDAEGLHVRMILGCIRNGLELQAVEARCGREDPLTHVLHLEVRHHGILIQVILRLADAFCIVEPVPGFDLAAGGQQAGGHIGVHHLLHVEHLGFGLPDGVFHNIGQEGIHGHRSLGHLVAENEGGGSIVTQQIRLFNLQAQDVEHNLLVVVLIAVVAARGIRAEHRLAAGAVLTGGHGRGIFGNRHAEGSLEGIVFREQVVAEAQRKGGQLGIDFAHAGLACLIETDAVLFKITVDFVEHTLLFGGQSQFRLLVVERLDLGKETGVHEDVVFMRGHDGSHLLHDPLDARRIGGL